MKRLLVHKVTELGIVFGIGYLIVLLVSPTIVAFHVWCMHWGQGNFWEGFTSIFR